MNCTIDSNRAMRIQHQDRTNGNNTPPQKQKLSTNNSKPARAHTCRPRMLKEHSAAACNPPTSSSSGLLRPLDGTLPRQQSRRNSVLVAAWAHLRLAANHANHLNHPDVPRHLLPRTNGSSLFETPLPQRANAEGYDETKSAQRLRYHKVA